jgi:hypothetical protein
MVLNIDDADYGIILDAVNEAKRIHETEDNVVAVSLICGEWLLIKSKNPVIATLDDYVKFIQRTFGVTLTHGFVTEPKKKKEIVEEPIETEDDVDLDGILESD